MGLTPHFDDFIIFGIIITTFVTIGLVIIFVFVIIMIGTPTVGLTPDYDVFIAIVIIITSVIGNFVTIVIVDVITYGKDLTFPLFLDAKTSPSTYPCQSVTN